MIKTYQNSFQNEFRYSKIQKQDCEKNYEKTIEIKGTNDVDNEHGKKEEEKINKEKLKNIQEMKKYLKDNGSDIKILEDIELLNFNDSGGESYVYNVIIKNKRNNGKIIREKRAIMKAILFNKREKENKIQSLIMSKLKNKNIIDLYGALKLKDDTFLLFMEEAKFSHLRNFQRKTFKKLIFSESMICFLAAQILKGISYCHRCKIAHLDIKLQNIVIDECLNAKLIDFSISIFYGNKKKSEFISLPCRGTSFYMPKEVLKSERIKIKDISKVDLYSLGVVLYNLAFNCYPYNLKHGDEDKYEEILKKIENNEIVFDNKMNYSSYFLDFLKQLLETDINKRISISEALNHYWIKGAEILMDEKEKCSNASIFISYLIVDHIKSFNEYLAKKD